VPDLARELILKGELPPGSHLNTTALAERMGVSLASVREAIIRLAKDGLVESRPYRGAFVVQLTPENGKDVCVLRSVLEGLAARLATEHAQPEDLKCLRQAGHEMELAFAAKDYTSYMSMNIHLHGQIVSLAGNSLLEEVWSRLAAQALLLLTVNLPKYVHLHQPNDHQLCLDAIASRDGDRAEQVIRDHPANFSLAVLLAADFDGAGCS